MQTENIKNRFPISLLLNKIIGKRKITQLQLNFKDFLKTNVY